MSKILGIMAIVFAFFAYRAIKRRLQQPTVVPPNAPASVARRRAWLQWYLVAVMFALAGVIYLVAGSRMELTPLQEAGLLIGGLALLFVPLLVVSRRD